MATARAKFADFEAASRPAFEEDPVDENGFPIMTHKVVHRIVYREFGGYIEPSINDVVHLENRRWREIRDLNKYTGVTVLHLENNQIGPAIGNGLAHMSKLKALYLQCNMVKQVDSLAEQQEFVKSRLNEFVRDFEGRLNIAELPHYESLTSRAKLAEKNVNLDDEARRESQLAVAQAALERIRELIGGSVFQGEALSPEGILTSGHFVALGPTVFYVSDDGRVSGLVETQLNAADPVVVPLPDADGGSITELASAGRGELPFDASLGRALKVEKARKTLEQYVADGGPVGLVILALGAAALMLTAFKAYEILQFRVASPESVDEILDELSQGSQAAAAKKSMQVPGVAGEMLETGVRHATQDREILEELLYEKILRVRPTLERFLPFLAITAAAAPLLGLLGTVIGMINTFQLITIFGTGDAKSLSSGISEALMTTAFGLMVAIPTLILHGALSRMAKRKLGLLEELSVAFVNGVDVLRSRVRTTP